MKTQSFFLLLAFAFTTPILAANTTTTASRDYVQSEIKAATTNIPFDQIKEISKRGSVFYLDNINSFGIGTVDSNHYSILDRYSLHFIDSFGKGSDTLYANGTIAYFDGDDLMSLLYLPSGAIGTIATVEFCESRIDAANPAFSNAVLAVGLNIDTNSVAVLNEVASTFGGFPVEGGGQQSGAFSPLS